MSFPPIFAYVIFFVLDLIALINEADKQGRVHWKTGSQPSFIASLPDETVVHYEYGWTTAKEYK
jgi:hypothetical protein